MQIEIDGLQWSTILDGLESLEKAFPNRKDECEALKQHLFATRDKSVAAIKTPPLPSIAAAYGIAPTSDYTDAYCEWDVFLVKVDPLHRIPTLKVVREITGLGLAQAMAVLNSAPTCVKRGISIADAKEWVAKFAEVKATAGFTKTK